MIKLIDILSDKEIELIQSFYPDFERNQIFKTDDEWDEFVDEIQDMVIPFLNVEAPTKEAIQFDDIVFKISAYD